jgi:outer membrane protein assembly factor BamD
MTHRSTRSIQLRSFLLCSLFPDVRITLTTGLTAAALLASTLGVRAQATAPAAAAQPAAQTAAPATATPRTAKVRKSKDDKVVASKDTIKADKKAIKDNPLLGQDAKLPDKSLYDKAEDAIKHGRFDVGRLDLQTLLNTYPDSQFMMRAKLAVADSWYKEGGTAALTQAEQEYKDFITFFPNAPEAAEAQMRIGDIYFRQMDKPDRDYSDTIHAEEEYRLMLQQFPESTLVPQARQRLREVQETLASREANIGAFYATHANFAATIARYQTVVDTYPLYSHLDDVLVGLGDAYEAEARNIRVSRLPEAAKARLLSIYDGQAKAAYEKVVLEHSASPHVEDAKDRLVGMGLPVPTPSAEQIAASEALENSRGQYTLSKRATLMFLHQADTVQAATIGTPPLEDPKLVSAATIVKQAQSDFATSMSPATSTPAHATPALVPDSTSAATGDPAAPTASAPPALQDVPAASAGGPPVDTSAAASPSTTTNNGNSMSMQIVQPSANSPTPGSTTFPGTQAAPAPATAAPAPAAEPQANGGIGPVGPANATPLPAVEKPAPAPAAINEAAGTKQPPAQLPATNGQKPKSDFDKTDESSSKHKKKKGLAKLNPF